MRNLQTGDMSISTAIQDRIDAIRDDFRAHRQEQQEHAALQQELASYRTPREIDDLLGAVADQEGPDAERIRSILLDNLRPTFGLGRI